jgi:hypothetical protein
VIAEKCWCVCHRGCDDDEPSRGCVCLPRHKSGSLTTADDVVAAAKRLMEDEEWVPIAMLARWSGLKNALVRYEKRQTEELAK